MRTNEQVRCPDCDRPCYANNEIRATFDPKTKARRVTETATWACTKCHKTVAKRSK